MLGCNLRCAYCWVVDDKKVGVCCLPELYPFQTPEETYAILKGLAASNNVKRMRVSGCEPLLNPAHLLSVIRMAVSDGYDYVLDTNGLLLDETFLTSIAPFRDKIYIYFGLKGSNAKIFRKLTTADSKYWYNQIETLRLVVKYGFTLGINIMANFTPLDTLPSLFKILHKVSPILPACVDMKKCEFFVHVSNRVKDYGICKYSSREVDDQWSWMLAKMYEPSLIHQYQIRETSRAFNKEELGDIQENVEWHQGLKFITLPKIPFQIPFADRIITSSFSTG
jgi:uncharacterized Fe-S cluster-containing radical SAM superfamily protein